MDSAIAGLGAALGFAALQVVNDRGPVGCLCPPLGAVAVLLFCLPGAPASQPRAVVGGHLIAGLVGYAVGWAGTPYPEAVAVAATIALMSAAGVVHPPAGAYAFLYVNKGMGMKGILAPGLLGACVLVATQRAFNATLKPLLSGKKKKS